MQRIDVLAAGRKVGTLALTKDNLIAFQYDEWWVNNGFSINPFKLPLSRNVFLSRSPYFKGLFGVFADSLPDSFGELVLERYIRSKGKGQGKVLLSMDDIQKEIAIEVR